MQSSFTPDQISESAKLDAMRTKAIEDYVGLWSAKTPDERLDEADRLEAEANPNKTTLQRIRRLILELDVCPETPASRTRWVANAGRIAAEKRASGISMTAAGAIKL